MADLIYHLAPAEAYHAAPEGEPYRPTAYEADGFIHCTAELAVLLEVANRFYQGTAGQFLVLDIDRARLTSELRFEPGQPPAPDGSPLAGVLFPHVYGLINREAIVAVRQARRREDGRFLAV